jgi:two-component system chemotaxis sensor kinase CheA
LVRFDPTDQTRRVETVAGCPVLRLRGQLLPIVSLAGALGVEEPPLESSTIIVVQSDETRFGLAVAQVYDTQEIVVKPLGRQLKGLRLYVGATIMGDGRVALILDIPGLAISANIGASGARTSDADASEQSDLTALLILEVGCGSRAALPLAAVSRLEEFAKENIERSGPTEVVQYRNGILPLIRLGYAIGQTDAGEESELVSVVVHGEGSHCVGLIVERVLDVVEAQVVANRAGTRHGVICSTVLQERVTDIVDLDAVLEAAGLSS